MSTHSTPASWRRARRVAAPGRAARGLGLSVALTLAAACFAPAAAAQDSRPLRIVGSGYSMPALMRPWVEAFSERTGIEIEVVPSGTSTGPPALIDGRADLAAMTRPLREAEATALEARFAGEAVAIPVARDEVAVFVNANNPLDRLTLAQVDAIYARDRLCGGPEDIVRWGQLGLGGEFADRAIALFGRRPGSGTATFFRNHALCGGAFKDWMRISPGQGSASLRVAESRFGIGFGSLRDLKPGMKVVAIARDAGAPYVRPGEPSPDSGYALARTFDFVVPRRGPDDQHPALIPFLKSVLELEAQSRATLAGYLPLNSIQHATAIERVNALAVRASASDPPPGEVRTSRRLP